MSKICCKCKQNKNILNFIKDKTRKDGYYPICKKCRQKYYLKNKQKILSQIKQYTEKNKKMIRKRRKLYSKLHKNKKAEYDKKYYLITKSKKQNYKLQKAYNISLEDYNKLLKSQNNRCSVCKKKETKKIHGTILSLSVDHNHETGKVRGLLCHKCNSAIGLFNDDIKNLQNAIKYLMEKK